VQLAQIVYPDWLGICLTLVTVLAAVGAGVVLLRSTSTRNTLSVDQAAMTAAQLQSQTDRNRIADLESMRASDREQIADLQGQVKTLTNIVTARDIILRGFVALGVPESVLLDKP
jgi:uncharacterized protein HemX